MEVIVNNKSADQQDEAKNKCNDPSSAMLGKLLGFLSKLNNRKKNKCNNPTTFASHYIESPESIRRVRDLNLRYLLDSKKLHLVLNVDNTLVHAITAFYYNKSSNKANRDDVHKILKDQMLVKLRPGVLDFLKKASKLFELSVYTRANERCARQMTKILEKRAKVRFSSVICKEDCPQRDKKGLDVVLSHQRLVLIVDVLDIAWGIEDRENLIQIKPYTYFHDKTAGSSDDDRELARLLGVLEAVHAKFFDVKEGDYHDDKDVRDVLTNVMKARKYSRLLTNVIEQSK